MVALDTELFRVEFDGLINRLGEMKKKPTALQFDPMDFKGRCSRIGDFLQARSGEATAPVSFARPADDQFAG